MIIIAKHPDLTNKIFGHLKVICETKDKKGRKAWLVECDCKNKTQIIINSTRLTNGTKQHCDRDHYLKMDKPVLLNGRKCVDGYSRLVASKILG